MNNIILVTLLILSSQSFGSPTGNMDVIDGINLLDNLNNESEVRCHDKPTLKYFKKEKDSKERFHAKLNA